MGVDIKQMLVAIPGSVEISINFIKFDLWK